MLQVYCSRRYSGDYDEGYRFTVAEVILETMMKVQVHCSRSYSRDYDEDYRFTVADVIL